jgi:hypothetical protein
MNLGEITAANTAHRDLDENLIGSKFWGREIHDLKVAILCQQ